MFTCFPFLYNPTLLSSVNLFPSPYTFLLSSSRWGLFRVNHWILIVIRCPSRPKYLPSVHVIVRHRTQSLQIPYRQQQSHHPTAHHPKPPAGIAALHIHGQQRTMSYLCVLVNKASIGHQSLPSTSQARRATPVASVTKGSCYSARTLTIGTSTRWRT